MSVAADAGTAVLPHRWDEEGVREHARRHDAVLALGRSAAGPGRLSLSPASVRSLPAPARLVLPSPDGSTIASHPGSTGAVCVAVCLRNAAAVAAWVAAHQAAAEVDASASVPVLRGDRFEAAQEH